MRILLWHGYLLAGTGSNVYTRALARAWSGMGHDVVVFSQEPHPERLDLGGARTVRPDIGGVLPVFVLDRYEGLEARYLHELDAAAYDRYLQANADALRQLLPADLVFTNHVLPGGDVAALVTAPRAVKVHGSELEYSIRGRARLIERARAALAQVDAVYVGSPHTTSVLEDVLGHVDRVHEVPPGVDVDEFAPAPREQALPALLRECRRDPPNPGGADARLPDEGNAERLAAFFATGEPTVLYFGKLLRNKGVHLLFEAMGELEARLLVVGFGDYRAQLERTAPPGTLFTGAFEHRHLAHVLPLCDVAVVPSIFPEAFGMVAAEAAAAGCPPLVARHSGLAEVAAGLEEAYGPDRAALASFRSGDAADLSAKLRAVLALSTAERRELGARARAAVVERWSWRNVSERLLAPFV